jgi:hypothetical protein
MRRLRRILSTPARLWRYLVVPPGGTYEQRYNAMTAAEQEQQRWQSPRRNGFFLTFINRRAPNRSDEERRRRSSVQPATQRSCARK